MATLVFTVIGTALGGPLGGAIGAMAGRQVDALLFAPKPREGPRLSELTVSSSSYGIALPRLHGRCRVPGQVIWATDLVETRSRTGNGKGRPATVTYSYSASFAVALSSRPIGGIGRIWADGKLLRGAAGDLKIGGSLRVHLGHGDQPADPLLAAAEGRARCPAHRGIAYVVFEDLQLADFGNRIPALSFEVLGDPAPLVLQDLIDPALPDCDAAITLDGLEGLSVEGAPADLLALLDPLYPLDCDASGAVLTLRPERFQAAPIALPEAAIATGDDQFGGKAGHARSRAAGDARQVGVLRHYDPDRDYQPGAQRASVRVMPGEPLALDLPATLAAPTARRLVEAAARRGSWSRQTLAWRMAQLDPSVRPGSLVKVPGQAGLWRVRAWEWRAEGIELALERVAPMAPAASRPSDPGRVGSDPDRPLRPTILRALELPWDGNPATPVPTLLAAAGSAGPGWTGAGLFADRGDGALVALGPASRMAAGTGTVLEPPGGASPLLIDRTCTAMVRLDDPMGSLADASPSQLAQGANRALLGSELIQFGEAEPLGGGLWRLSGLWRGRGGTEAAIGSHLPGEPFVLIDDRLTLLEAGLVGDPAGTTIAAIGLADAEPVTSPIALAGIGWRPLAPVHGQALTGPAGLSLRWTRRSRGGWRWDDGADQPLNEEREAYRVEFVRDTITLAQWDCTRPELLLGSEEWFALAASAPAGRFAIRQLGTRGISLPLLVTP